MKHSKKVNLTFLVFIFHLLGSTSDTVIYLEPQVYNCSVYSLSSIALCRVSGKPFSDCIVTRRALTLCVYLAHSTSNFPSPPKPPSRSIKHPTFHKQSVKLNCLNSQNYPIYRHSFTILLYKPHIETFLYIRVFT
jgi:hypothetical protein